MIKKAIMRVKSLIQIKFNLTLSLNDSIFSAPIKRSKKFIIAESTLIVKLFVYLVLINFSKMNRSVQYG